MKNSIFFHKQHKMIVHDVNQNLQKHIWVRLALANVLFTYYYYNRG